MLKHEKFEEMCALKATGQLAAQAEQQLEEHLMACERCRAVSDDFALIIRELPCPSPKLADRTVLRQSQQGGFRSRFLENARVDGLRFSEEAQHGPNKPFGFFPSTFSLRPALAYGLAAIMAVGILAYYKRVEHRDSEAAAVRQSAPNQQTDKPAPVAANRTSAAVDELNKTLISDNADKDGLIKSLSSRLEKVEAELETRRSENERLELTIRQLHDASVQLSSQSNENDLHLQQIRAELEKANAARAAVEAELNATKAEASDLAQQLRTQLAAEQRERELLSVGRDIRDLMGARNLHVIDVHDADGRGKDKKSFGRVFYTEGNSLIFYAYDLDEKKVTNANYAFHAWGEKLGQPSSVKSLGFLYVDSKEQKRWVLKVDDPQQLATIDSVFVTLEPHSNGNEVPRGHKILYAFLGGVANHP